jgi:hypothetical protein
MLETSAVGSADALLEEIEVEYEVEDDEEAGILDASRIQTKVVEWLWYPYLPKNMLVMEEGESELGKTAVELDLIAIMTTGSP